MPPTNPLSGLLSIDQLPDALHLENLLPGFLDDIDVKSHLVDPPDAPVEEGTHTLELEFSKTIGITIPGSEIRLLLNPSQEGSPQVTTINLEVYYKWLILKYINNFSLDNLPLNFNDLYGVLDSIQNIDLNGVLEKLVAMYEEASDTIQIPVQAIVDELNRFYNLAGTVNEIDFGINTPSFQDLENALINAGISLAQVVNDMSLTGVVTDPNSAAEVLGAVIKKGIYQLVQTLNATYNLDNTPDVLEYRPDLDLSGVVGKLTSIGKDAMQVIKDTVVDITSSFENIKKQLFDFITIDTTDLPKTYEELFLPDIDASVKNVVLALEFPRSMLIPMDDNDEFLPEPATAKLKFKVGDFRFSTQNGYDFQEVSECELKKASILETGITIEFLDCLIDFHTDSNIPQADADGRPDDFQGVFIDSALIKLPEFWQEDPSTPTTAIIEGDNLLIGMPGGISGLMQMKTDPSAPGDLLHFDIPGIMKVSLRDFDLTLIQNVIDQANINGTLGIPMIKKTDGTDSEIDISVNISNDIYTIQGTNFDTVEIAQVKLDIQGLIISLQKGELIPPTNITGNLTFPVLDDGNSNPVPMAFTGHILENSRKITVSNVPQLSLLGIGVTLQAFEIEFDDSQILNSDITGTLTFPFLNDPNNPGQPFALTINYKIKEDGFEIHGTNISRMDLLGIGVDFDSIDIFYDKQGIDNFNLEGDLFLPLFKKADGTESKLGFSYTVKQNDYKFTCSPAPSIFLFGVELDLNDFVISYTGNQLNDISLGGKIIFPVLEEEGGGTPDIGFSLFIGQTQYQLSVSNIPWLYILGLGIKLDNISATFSKSSLDHLNLEGKLKIPFLKANANDSQDALVDLSFKLKPGGFELDVASFPKLFLEGIELEFDPLSLDVPNSGLSQLTWGGKLKFPGLEPSGGGDGKISFNLEYDNGKYTISAASASLPPLSLGGLDISLTGLTISFDKNGLIAADTEISGKISLPAFNVTLDVNIKIEDDGFLVEAKVPQGTNYIEVLKLEDFITVQLAGLSIGKSGNNWSFGFSGKIINHLSVPGLEKFVPEIINIDKFDLTPSNDIDLDFDMEWPNGFKIENIGAGGSTTVPVNMSFGDVMSMRAIQIDTKVAQKTEIEVTLLGTKFNLGPVTCVIEGIGLEAVIEKKSNGNLGPIDVDLGFVPPKGIGISLDASVIKGGGYLFFDHDNNRYAGALELSFQDAFMLSAIGLLTTVLPDGSKGTSLLIIITTEFPAPIQLGYGFTLSGVGGLLGLHRTSNTDELRKGVVSNSIDNVLFPENVIANISQIISDLRLLFPPRRDQFLIGPMALLGWGTPTLIRAELGLIIEFSDPFAIVILGVLKASIPDEKAALIKLQVNFVGVLNFDEGYISFDAALYDSRIVSFTLEGSMALRIMWGKHQDFAISVGGFHPSYKAPSHLMLFDMKRLTITIMGGNPRLVLTSYFAITTNTVQFGAQIDFRFKVWKVKIVGWFGFDVLFQFDPFKFIADVSAGLAVKWGSSTLFSISLAFSLQGPSPWIAKGTAKFKVLFFTVKAKFSEKWGEEKSVPLPDIRVLPLVIEALENKSNWKAELPDAKNYELVVLRTADADEDDIVLASNGSLRVSQKVVPLGIEITRFGNSKPAGVNLFDIDSIALVNPDGEIILEKINVKQAFAPAAYKEMEDSDRLSSPSFEEMKSGVKAISMDDIVAEWGINRNVEYEVIVSDYQNEDDPDPNLTCFGVRQNAPMVMEEKIFTHFARGGAVRDSALSKKKKAAKIQNPRMVNLKQPGYKIVNSSTLVDFVESGFTGGSRAEANEALLNILKSSPGMKGKLMIVPEHKAVPALG